MTPSLTGTSAASRRYRLALVLLILANLALVWALPVLPCQDLPQHLAYARIFRDYARPDLPYHDLYQFPDRLQPYHSVYLVLAFLGRALSILDAMRVLMSLYVIALFLSFQFLCRVCAAPAVPDLESPESPASPAGPGPPWAGLLGCLLVFGPIIFMGFCQFFLSIPVFLLGCAVLLRACGPDGTRRDIGFLIACCAALSSLHPVAAACLVLLSLLKAVFQRDARALSAGLVSLFSVAVVLLIWRMFGALGMGQQFHPDVTEELRSAYGLEVLNNLFKITWYDPLAKANFVLWTVFGPFRMSGVLLVALVMAAAALLLRHLARPITSGTGPAPIHDPSRAATRRAFVAFAVLSWFAPWGIYKPTELTFLNFRMIGLAFALLLCLLPSHLFAKRRAQTLLCGFCLFFEVHLGYHAAGFAREARQTLALLDEAHPAGVMLSLMHHHPANDFGKLFRLTHFLPMYYTVIHDGTNTQFWGQYVEHLPIAFRPGKHLDVAQDWYPWQFKPEHLDLVDYVLFQAATADDPVKMRNASRSAAAILQRRAALIRCEGDVCLYRTQRGQAPIKPP